MKARGCLGLVMLLPFILVFLLALAVSFAPFIVIAACMDWFQKGGLSRRTLGALASLISGGICIRLGYWLAIEGSIDWRSLTGFPEARFPFLEWLFPFVFPILGWIDMIGGVLLAVVGSVSAFKRVKA